MPDTTDDYTETSKEFERRIVDMIQRQMSEVKRRVPVIGELDVIWVLTD